MGMDGLLRRLHDCWRGDGKVEIAEIGIAFENSIVPCDGGFSFGAKGSDMFSLRIQLITGNPFSSSFTPVNSNKF